MGRYYKGDIEGKFWFGVQSSSAAARFGDGACENNYIPYYFDNNNFETEVLEKLLLKVNKKYSREFTLASDPDELTNIAADSDLADAQLGLLIHQCILEKGSCEFTAET